MDISFIDEIKNWEKMFDIDKDISEKIQKQFEQLEVKI